MFRDFYFDNYVSEVLLEEQIKRDKEHKSSGKLSASMLWQPLQWQVLKCKGIPQKEVDKYTLRKFLRGKMIEEWALKFIPGLQPTIKEGKQDFVEYNGVIGFIDANVDTEKWQKNFGIIPHEIKSVSNAKFKRIAQKGQPDKGHILQGALYSLASKKDNFAIDYISTDDLRIITWIFDVKDYKDEIDKIIARFNETMAKDEIPVFEANEKWQEKFDYNNYPDWKDLSFEECQIKYKKII